MIALRTFFQKLRWLRHRQQAEAEMAEEMRFHLQARTDEAIGDGLPPEEARRAAERRFGNVGLLQERCRDERVWPWLEQVGRDFRFGFRSLARSPGFAAIALLTLGLSIGANTSMYSIVSALMLRTPYPQDNRLVRIFRTSKYSRRWPHSPPNFLDQRADNTVFEQEAATSWIDENLSRDGAPAERLHGLKVTADFFPLLGVKPALGRWFTPQEDGEGADDAAILSHGLWVQRFGGDPTIIGRRIRLDSEPVTVVGVMPANFDDPFLWGPVQIYRPLAFSAQDRQSRDQNYLGEVARLKPGVTLAQAQAELSALVANIDHAHPDNGSDGLRAVPLAQASQDDAGQNLTLFVTSLAVLVLLIGCANLANLQFARYVARTREQGIRGALGATRGRLMRSILIECLELALAGGVLATGVAAFGNAWLRHHVVIVDEPLAALPLDWPVIGFLFLLSAATGIGFGLLPAWLLTKPDVNDALRQGGTGATAGSSHHRLRHALVAAEVALALTLLAAAGFYLHGVNNMLRRNLGWRPEGVLAGWIRLDTHRFSDAKKRQVFFDRLLSELAAIPRVRAAAIGSQFPVPAYSDPTYFETPEMAGARQHDHMYPSAITSISPEYFAAMGIPVLQGRIFATMDRADSANVAIVNEALAHRFWPGKNPIGQRVAFGSDRPDWWQVVGVVADVRPAVDFAQGDSQYQIYRPLPQLSWIDQAVIIRTPGDPALLADSVRSALRRMDSGVALFELGPAAGKISTAFANFNVGIGLLDWFAGLGVLLAAVGIYGVISGWVAQRTAEIGVRIALGAQRSDILGLVLGTGLRVVLTGLVLGAFGAWTVGRGLSSIMGDASPGDATTAIVVTLLLLVTAIVACLIPAHRAAKINPVVALRGD